MLEPASPIRRTVTPFPLQMVLEDSGGIHGSIVQHEQKVAVGLKISRICRQSLLIAGGSLL